MGSSQAMEGGEKRARKRVVLVPYPFQGHITPMLQLGSILNERGFSITIAHTTFNSPDPSNFPDFTFLALPDNLDGHDSSFYNSLNFKLAMDTNCEAPFEDGMIGMMETGEVACVIYDNIMTFVDAVTRRLKIPTAVLRTTSAAYMHSHVALFQLAEDKRLPLQESQLLDPVPDQHPLRFKDLPFPATKTILKPVEEFLRSFMNIRSSKAVIWNTLETFDESPLLQLQHHWPVPYFAVGPLHKLAPPVPTSLMEEDTSCLSWLDKQALNSVIYVSLGSLAVIDEKELLEMAWGLAESHHPFLWVVRPSLLNDKDVNAYTSLPEEFKKAVGERGLVVKWAPQRKVLEHSAVGGFLSHCGWNSTLESLCEGVPMICRPWFADQIVNTRYLTHVWRVGLEVETSVAQAVRTLMSSDLGREMRGRALEMKIEIEREMKRGGSWFESFDRLVKFIDLL